MHADEIGIGTPRGSRVRKQYPWPNGSAEMPAPPVRSVPFAVSIRRSQLRPPFPLSAHCGAARSMFLSSTVAWTNGVASAAGTLIFKLRMRKSRVLLPALSAIGRHVSFEPHAASSIAQREALPHARFGHSSQGDAPGEHEPDVPSGSPPQPVTVVPVSRRRVLPSE